MRVDSIRWLVGLVLSKVRLNNVRWLVDLILSKESGQRQVAGGSDTLQCEWTVLGTLEWTSNRLNYCLRFSSKVHKHLLFFFYFVCYKKTSMVIQVTLVSCLM